MQVVGVSLVRNEDRVHSASAPERADFCDRLFVADHLSNDHSPALLAELERELDHLELRRVRDAAESHAFASDSSAPTGGSCRSTATSSTTRRARALPGCARGRESTPMSPAPPGWSPLRDPRRDAGNGSRLSLTGEPAARRPVQPRGGRVVDERSGRAPHGGEVVFRPGFDWESRRHLGEEEGWEGSALRCLHVCFLRRVRARMRRSFRPGAAARTSTRRALTAAGCVAASSGWHDRLSDAGDEREQSVWKAEKYRRGERVTVDASVSRLRHD